MARVGNEARLILKLADERHRRMRDSFASLNKDRLDRVSGYNQCFQDVWSIFHTIIEEMEAK